MLSGLILPFDFAADANGLYGAHFLAAKAGNAGAPVDLSFFLDHGDDMLRTAFGAFAAADAFFAVDLRLGNQRTVKKSVDRLLQEFGEFSGKVDRRSLG